MAALGDVYLSVVCQAGGPGPHSSSLVGQILWPVYVLFTLLGPLPESSWMEGHDVDTGQNGCLLRALDEFGVGADRMASSRNVFEVVAGV